jgi:hypothetical protein
MTLTYNTETWILTNKNKSKICIVDVHFLRSSEEKAEWDRIRNQIFKEDGIKSLLTKSERGQLQ